MKKLVLIITLVAAVATGFMSCNKTTHDSDTHTQKFTLGTASFDINNATTIESIKDSIGQVYNAIVLSQSEKEGQTGANGKAAIIVFSGDFTSGTHNLVFDPEQPLHFPLYLVGDAEVDNFLNFCLDSILNQADIYAATSGSFTLAMSGNQFTVTGTGIEVKKVKDLTQVSTSSVDFEDIMLRYVLSDVVEGNFNDSITIVTAGRTNISIFNTPTNIVAFVAENGDMVGFLSWASFEDGIPVGTYTNTDNLFVYIQRMNVQTLQFPTGGEMTVAREGDIYTINMTGMVINGISGTSTLHYVGTMPYFDFSFFIPSN